MTALRDGHCSMTSFMWCPLWGSKAAVLRPCAPQNAINRPSTQNDRRGFAEAKTALRSGSLRRLLTQRRARPWATRIEAPVRGLQQQEGERP